MKYFLCSVFAWTVSVNIGLFFVAPVAASEKISYGSAQASPDGRAFQYHYATLGDYVSCGMQVSRISIKWNLENLPLTDADILVRQSNGASNPREWPPVYSFKTSKEYGEINDILVNFTLHPGNYGDPYKGEKNVFAVVINYKLAKNASEGIATSEFSYSAISMCDGSNINSTSTRVSKIKWE